MKADRRSGAQSLAGDGFEILTEMPSDPVRDELALCRHVDAVSHDLDLRGVVEPHSESVLADSVDQSI
jgi:hypothetical protein